ncbi:hypothetical protein ACFP1I_04000 [Dyadobacter subterraneus]|uniref:FHA domain-containing protein n=1 Tax=Dyadobacter subterraneus TaxID=2773304 RepID=A0ABR9WGT0_9BACT|nr:hypothetical protein [Dyadobacter subterraneus]MBE9464707.1 hypothetical protein [Dyadobacter subterraneus]
MEFYYAKLNFFDTIYSLLPEEAVLSGSRIEVLEEGMKIATSVTSQGSKFMFADVSREIIEGESYLYGKIVKYADRKEKVANVEELTTDSVIVPDRILSESHFVIEFKENFLLYTESKSHLNKNSFIVKFNDLISKVLIRATFNCEAYPVSDQYSFFNRLSDLQEVLELELTIFPTNPFPSKVIEEIDNVLKEQNVKVKYTKYKAKPGGLNVKDKEIKENSTYADIGYGKGQARGIDKSGNAVRISSQKSDKQRSVTIDPKSRNPFDILQEINNRINEKNK